MNQVLEELRQWLSDNSNETIRKRTEYYFKEDVKAYGIKASEVKAVSKEFYKGLKGLPKDDIFNLCQSLWQSGFLEESFIASHWSLNVRKEYSPGDINVFGYWINNYVSNWASCDTLCPHNVGDLIKMYPETVYEVTNWAHSSNRWMRRASAVSFILLARRGLFLKEIFEIADILLTDKDDMVQKGYGWMLKSASQAHQQEIFDYVLKNKNVMPRTALRYAIEKMPEDMRKEAMSR